MANWTGKLGYPLVEVTQNGDELELKQTKFNLDGNKDNDSTLWMIPITFKSDTETLSIVFDKTDEKVAVKSSSWINTNLNSAGFFVTKLSDNLFERMLSNLSELDVPDRLKLVYDQLQLSKSGHANSGAFFDLLLKFKSESNF